MQRSGSVMLALLLTTATAARGQGRSVFLSPYGGVFIATSSLGSVQALDQSGAPITLTGKVLTTAGFGARLAYWSSNRFGLEGSFFYDKPDVRVTDGHTSTVFDSQVQVASVKALVQLGDGLSGADFVVGGGLAGIRHGGTTFAVSGPTTNIGGIGGGGILVDVGSQLQLRLDGEVLVYQWRARSGFPSKLQADLMMTAGASIRLSR